MFCPECRAEYRRGFTKCRDCDVDLVDSLAEPEPQQCGGRSKEFLVDNRVEISRFLDVRQAEFAVSVLEGSGVEACIECGICSYVCPSRLPLLQAARLMRERLSESAADVTSRDDVEALAVDTVRRFGAVHIVCNNAGVATFGLIATSTHRDWQFTMNVNFWGVVHGIEVFVPLLLSIQELLSLLSLDQKYNLKLIWD